MGREGLVVVQEGNLFVFFSFGVVGEILPE